MPTDILNQLRGLREGIAEELRRDPRFLTLSALDRSIREIAGVLQSSGVLPPGGVPPLSPVDFGPVPSAIPAAGHPEAASTMSPRAAQAAAAAPPAVPRYASPGAALVTGGLAAGAAGAAGSRRPAAPAPSPAAGEGVADPDAEADLREAEHPPPVDGVLAEGEHGQAEHEDARHAGEAGQDVAHDGEHEAVPALHAPDVDHHAGQEHEAGQEHDGEPEQALEPYDAPYHPEPGEPAPADVVPPGRASGYLPMEARPGAQPYQPSIYVKFGKPPTKVDLRPLMAPVEDGGDVASGVAGAVASAYEYWIRRTSRQDQAISRLFVYYNARWRDGAPDEDGGSAIQLAMEGLARFGACPEAAWPHDAHLVLKKPGADAYREGAPFRVQDMQRVPLRLEAWKQALAEGKPIVFGCAVFDGFAGCATRGGVVPMPAPDDLARGGHAVHALCAVGYSDGEKVFIVRNAWGPDWGDGGHCYMPYDYALNPRFNDGDCWVFVPKVPQQPPREVWSDATDPVTDGGRGVDFALAPYAPADYEHVAVDLWEGVRRPFNAAVPEDYAHYAAAVARGQWGELESFDVRTYLASTAAMAGIASWVAEEFPSGADDEGAGLEHHSDGAGDARSWDGDGR